MKRIYIDSKDEWRSWLERNYNTEDEVWLVFNKVETGQPSIPYEDAVEQALCFGWIDSLIKKLNENQYARKFTPRRADSKWSVSNIKRVEKMIKAGLMTPHGLKLVETAKRKGTWDEPVQKPRLDIKIHPDFVEALKEHPAAQKTFDDLSATHQKQYITWIGVAKRDQTRARRISESIELLTQGKELGLR